MSEPESVALPAGLRSGIALLERRAWQLAITLAVVVIGLLNALPHLHEAIWQDEAATLEFHASHGFLHPFVHYGTPNNHIAFSAMLAAWRSLLADPLDPGALRLLPLGLFLLAIPVTFAAARRMGGALCAAIAALLFAASSVAGNFATQLRGYGPSWLFASLALLCALNVRATRGAWRWRAGYCLAVLALSWILPTSVFLAEAMAVAVAAYLWLDPRNRNVEGLRAVAIVLLAPPAGLLLAYAPVWHVLMYASGVVDSPWTAGGLLLDWWHGTMSDYRWFVPIAGAGLLVGAIGALRSRRESEGRRELLLAVLLLAGPAIALAAMPRTPFPRTLVPYLPVWYCAVGFLASQLVREFEHGAGMVLCAAALIALALPLPFTANTRPCRQEGASGGPTDYDLCHQYFRDNYHPDRVIAIWSSLGRADVPIATDFEGYHALRAIGSRAHVFEYQWYPHEPGQIPLLVAHDDQEMKRMVAELGLEGYSFRLIADTGYFRMYAPAH